MAISKERLEELIEKNATVYELFMNKEVLKVELNNSYYIMLDKVYENKLGKLPLRPRWLSDLFETKEDAEWTMRFKRIPRTDYLDLPTWEEFIEKEEVGFYQKYGRYTSIKILGTKYIAVETSFERYYTGELTKENYTLACEKARELFLGENK